MMKPKYLLFSAALLAMTQAVALTPVRKQTQMPAAKKQVNKATLSVADKDAPAYTIVGKDSTCQIFVYSPKSPPGTIICLENEWAIHLFLTAPRSEVRGTELTYIHPS